MNQTINIIYFALLFLFVACSSDSTSVDLINDYQQKINQLVDKLYDLTEEKVDDLIEEEVVDDLIEEESSIPEQKESPTNKWSDSQKKQALNDCITSGNPKEFCECSIVQLTSLFSYEEFNTFNSEIRSGKQPSPEIISKMIEMSKRVQSECPQTR